MTAPARDHGRSAAPDENRQRQVTRSAVVPAAPAAVFALLSSPGEHVRLDGSGMVRGVLDAPERLVLGSPFRMQMKGYTVRNVVVEHEQDALIAWRHRGRHVWRWQLRPVAGGTEVSGTFDHSSKRCPALVRAVGLPRRAGRALEGTLDRLAERLG